MLSASSRRDCLKIARRGLEEVYSTVKFSLNGEELSLRDAMRSPCRGRFKAAVIRGAKEKRAFALPVSVKSAAFSSLSRAPTTRSPIEGGCALARGEDAVSAATAWANAGVVERSCIRAIEQAASGEWDRRLADHVFVVMGAGAVRFS